MIASSFSRTFSLLTLLLALAVTACAGQQVTSTSPDKAYTIISTWNDAGVPSLQLKSSESSGASQKPINLGHAGDAVSTEDGNFEIIWPKKGPYVLVFAQYKHGSAYFFANLKSSSPHLAELSAPDWPAVFKKFGVKATDDNLKSPNDPDNGGFTGPTTLAVEWGKALAGTKDYYTFKATYDLSKGPAPLKVTKYEE